MGKRTVSQRRGRGSIFRAPSHRYKTDATHPSAPQRLKGEVQELIKDPARIAPVARVTLEDGSEHLVLAPEGLAIGDTIEYRSDESEVGNFVRLGEAVEGTAVFNIEIQPGDGGKLVRAAGTNAVVVGRTGNETVVRLPSGEFKALPDECMAQVGQVAGGGAIEKPMAKAGKKRHANRSKARYYPTVRGVAKNPVDHPHGGGQKQHVGQPGTSSRNAPPGRKVGSIAAKRTGRK